MMPMMTVSTEMTAPDHPASAEVDPGSVDSALALAGRLLAAVEGFAQQHSLPELGDIELPPVVGSAADQAHLRSVAPLYLAAELEEAGLVPAVELLAGVFASGGLQADLGPAAALLVAFWQERNHRFTAAERRAFFGRLFGSPGPALATPESRNTAFEPLLIDLAEALYRLDPEPGLGGLPSSQVPVRMAARQLTANLVPRGGGMASFAAGELLGAVQRALAILKHPQVQGAFGASSVWGAARNISQRYRREDPDVGSHVTRGKSGMLLLAWLAEVLPVLDDVSGVLVAPGDPVLAAATAWLQASLTLTETAPPIGPGTP
jgi:hypothetical protein